MGYWLVIWWQQLRCDHDWSNFIQVHFPKPAEYQYCHQCEKIRYRKKNRHAK